MPPFLDPGAWGALLLVTACGADTSVAGPPGPGLVCAEPSVDFGAVWQGAVLEHEFVFEAYGDEALVVAAARADCGCTVAQLELSEDAGGPRRPYATGEPIPPGARLHVHVRYHTAGKRGATPRTVSLYGPTPEGRVQVTIHADVRRWLTVTPERIDLPPMTENEATEVSFRVASADGTPFALSTSGRAVPPEVVATVQADQPDEAGRSSDWTALVRLGPGLPRGPRGYPIEFLTDVPNPGAPRAEDGSTAPFSGTAFLALQVVGPVSLSPPTLTLGLMRPDETVSRTVRVICHDPAFELPEPVVQLVPLRPGEDSPLQETASITTRRVEGLNAWDVELVLEGLDPKVPATFLARLVIETSHPAEPRLEAPITGFHLGAGRVEGADR